MQDVTVTDVTCLRIHSVTDNESCSSTYLCPNCVAACISQLQDFLQHHCPCTCTQTRGKEAHGNNVNADDHEWSI